MRQGGLCLWWIFCLWRYEHFKIMDHKSIFQQFGEIGEWWREGLIDLRTNRDLPIWIRDYWRVLLHRTRYVPSRKALRVLIPFAEIILVGIWIQSSFVNQDKNGKNRQNSQEARRSHILTKSSARIKIKIIEFYFPICDSFYYLHIFN